MSAQPSVETLAWIDRYFRGPGIPEINCSTAKSESAQAWAAGGWEVFPLNGKIPAIRGGRGVLDATTDPEQIKAWWDQYPDANVGVRVPENMVVLDVDGPNRRPHPGKGLEGLAQVEAEHGPLPTTLTQITGSGGLHLVFKRPAGKLSKAGLPAGLEYKDHGGYIVGAQSIHPDTAERYILCPHEIVDMPTWLAEMITIPPPARDAQPSVTRPLTTYSGESIIDQYNAEHTWLDVLGPQGWTCRSADPDADGAVWLHPTHTSDCSATIRDGSLYVYSSNTPFDQTSAGDPRGYDKFDAYALLHHGGDKSAAAKALRPPTDYGHTDFGAAPSAATSAAEVVPARRPQVRAAGTLKPAAVPRWLAQKRIPRGQVTVLVGDEGIGKSLFWVWIVAYVTTGRALPEFGIPARAPGVALLIITEDAWDTDVRARLEAAGADLDNVRVLCEDEDGNGAPVFPRDFDLIRDYGEPLSLIVVDAWLDTVSAGLKVSDTQQARQALDPWKTTAARTDAAVLLLAHTNRIASGSARDRIGATAALRQKARMLLLAQLDEDDNLTVGPEKANGVRIVDAASFTIAGVQRFAPTDDHDGTVPLINYAGDSDRTARQIHEDMHAAAKNQRGNSEPDDEVSLWLRGTIEAAAPCWAAPAYEEAEMRGWSADKVKRAKKKLGAVARKDADTGHWYWTLPRQGSTEGGKGAPHRVHPAPLPSSQVSEGSAPPSKPTPSDLQGSEGSEGRRYIEFERPEVRREASSGTTSSPSAVEQHGQQTWGGAA